MEDQITIPEDFPIILKNFAKAAIKSNPTDLLSWSLQYFIELGKGGKYLVMANEENKEKSPEETKNGDESTSENEESPDRVPLKELTKTHVDHLAALEYDDEENTFPRLSKIVCTIGPNSSSVEVLFELMQAGMNIARLNFSHGTHEHHEKIVQNIRQAAKKMSASLGWKNYPVGIALDIQGPKIRTGTVEGDPNGQIKIKKGSIIKLTTDEQFKDRCSAEQIYIDYKNLTQVVEEGSSIFVDDGYIIFKVTKIESNSLEVKALDDYMLGSHKGVNIPDAEIDLPALSDKDKDDIQFGIKLGVDFIFASFVRNADGVGEIKQILGEEGKEIEIISKIECMEGVRNMEEIINVTDGVMVARGDLGLNIPTHKIFLVQKTLIAKCQLAGVPIICATQMLESMIQKPRPTRAEACDVANAILDGADCTMLSGETATGKFPASAVKNMSAICREAERTIDNRQLLREITLNELVPTRVAAATAFAAVSASILCQARAILVVTKQAYIAFQVAKFRPRCPIIAITALESVTRLCQMRRGIFALHFKKRNDEDDVRSCLRYGVEMAKKLKYLRSGDTIITMAGWIQGLDYTDTVRIVNIE